MSTNLLHDAEGRFGRYLAAAMQNNDKDARMLATEAHTVYEHVRKLIKGMALPSMELCDRFEKALKGFNAKEGMLIADKDRAERKLGSNFAKLTGVPADASALMKAWDYLTPMHKQTITTMATAFEKEARAAKRK